MLPVSELGDKWGNPMLVISEDPGSLRVRCFGMVFEIRKDPHLQREAPELARKQVWDTLGKMLIERMQNLYDSNTERVRSG